MDRRSFLKGALLTALAASLPLEAAQKLVDKATVNDDCAFIKSGDYVEITFYGTGLSMITNKLIEDKKIAITVDGMPADGVLKKVGALTDRNYCTHQLHPVVDGLPLGIHTMRIAVKEDIKVTAFDITSPMHVERIFNNAETQQTNNS